MSQTSKTLKKIASGEEYKGLVAAIEKSDYENIFNYYIQISKLLSEAGKEIEQKIENLPRRNRDEDRQKFQAAFALRIKGSLPQWHRLDSEIKKQKTVEGRVFALGSKGDPLARTPEGRVVIVTGAKLTEGENVTLKVVEEGEKVDFGEVFKLTPQSLYTIINHDILAEVRNSLAEIREHLNHWSAASEDGLAQLSELLKELENVRELASKLQPEEKDKTIARVISYRKSLLEAGCPRLVFDFIAQQEEREIKESCQGDEQQWAKALLAPGLFQHQAHEKIKAELLSGENPKGYSEIMHKLETNLTSMNSAVELLEFKAAVEEVYPSARIYLEKMDRLFRRLAEKTRELALTLAQDKVCSAEDIHAAIKNTFSAESLSAELRKVFRSAEEFFTLRKALLELKIKIRLGYTESAAAEAALRPYLRQKITSAFR